MSITRREFVHTSAMVGAGLWITGRPAFGQTPLDPIKNLRKFVAQLPGLGPTGIPLGTPNTDRFPGTDYYTLAMGQYRQQLHPDLPATKLWGYGNLDPVRGLVNFRYLGPAIVATRGTPVRINLVNLLPNIHPLPVDTTIPGAETGQQVNRAVIHLHGGFVPWSSDGGPFQWVAPNGTHGPSHINWLPNHLGLLTDDYWYPNAQTARFMWYHDHAVGITRLNAYAGLAAPYLIVDDDEIRMFGSRGSVLRDQMPGIPLALQDKSFKNVADQWGRVGDLWYPSSYGPPEGPGTPPPISAVPEFFADTPIINGMAYPELTLPAGVHRFRLLSGTQSRFWNLQLYKEDVANPGDANLKAKGPDFIQIGTEGGFLPKPVVVPSGNQFDVAKYFAHDPSGYSLMLAPAERMDVLVDFSESAGSSFILYSDPPGPFPFGEDAVDYYTGHGAPDSAHGPNTRTLMRIRITAAKYHGPTQKTGLIRLLEAELASINLGLLVHDSLIGRVFEGIGIHRNKTLSEGFDEFGRLQQFLGTDTPGGAGGTTYGMHFEDALKAEERHSVGATETWDIYNTTGDTHPIHFHLVNVQVLGRAPFAQDPATGEPLAFTPSGDFVPPDDNERGYKETVRMNPGEITRVVMRFDLPPDPVVRVLGRDKKVTVPKSPRTGGYEYVWHCHILEHEEHDMMRPLVVGL